MIKRIERKDGPRFQVYRKTSGQRVYVGTFGTLKEAKEAEQDHAVTQRKIASGELPPEVDLKRTFGEAVAEWLESLVASKSRSEEGYSDRMRLYVLPTLRGAKLSRITKGNVIALRDDLATRLAPATVNGTLVCLSSAFASFVDRGWVDKNPCLGVKPIEDSEATYNWITSREEITRLLAAAAGDLREMIAFALATGTRLDEMLHLQWVDVDLARRQIAIHRGRQGTVKSGKLRHVPVLDVLLPVLRERALRRDGAVFVFPGRAGKVRSKQGVTKIYKLALKRAGLDTKLRWHDLRHTMASHWMMDGGDIFRLSKILGHSSVRITEKKYAHLAPETWQQDYHRLAFVVPSEAAKVYSLHRDAAGKIIGRDAVVNAG